MPKDKWSSDIRLLLNILCTPKLREQFADALLSGKASGVVGRLSFLGITGFDEARAGEVRDAFNRALDPVRIFDYAPLDLPSDRRVRLELSKRACATAFARAGWRSCTEAELNAALSQLVTDVALARRDCIDCGFLRRDPFGSRYQLAPTSSH